MRPGGTRVAVELRGNSNMKPLPPIAGYRHVMEGRLAACRPLARTVLAAPANPCRRAARCGILTVTDAGTAQVNGRGDDHRHSTRASARPATSGGVTVTPLVNSPPCPFPGTGEPPVLAASIGRFTPDRGFASDAIHSPPEGPIRPAARALLLYYLRSVTLCRSRRLSHALCFQHW